MRFRPSEKMALQLLPYDTWNKWGQEHLLCPLLLVTSLLLVVRPGAASSVRSLLVAMPFAPSSFLLLVVFMSYTEASTLQLTVLYLDSFFFRHVFLVL